MLGRVQCSSRVANRMSCLLRRLNRREFGPKCVTLEKSEVNIAALTVSRIVTTKTVHGGWTYGQTARSITQCR